MTPLTDNPFDDGLLKKLGTVETLAFIIRLVGPWGLASSYCLDYAVQSHDLRSTVDPLRLAVAILFHTLPVGMTPTPASQRVVEEYQRSRE